MPFEQPARDKTTRLNDVGTLLREEDKVSIAGSLGRFLRGLGICFVMGLSFAIVMTLLFDSLFENPWIGWKGWFLIYAFVTAGLLIWRERGPVTVDLEQARHPAPPIAGSSAIIKYASMPFWGPRAVVEGLRGMRGRWVPHQQAIFDRAAILVLDLAMTDGGVPVKEVLHPPEDMVTFGLAVDWLDANQWIGQATEGGSLWLSTVGRKKLVDRKLMPLPGDFQQMG